MEQSTKRSIGSSFAIAMGAVSAISMGIASMAIVGVAIVSSLGVMTGLALPFSAAGIIIAGGLITVGSIYSSISMIKKITEFNIPSKEEQSIPSAKKIEPASAHFSQKNGLLQSFENEVPVKKKKAFLSKPSAFKIKP